MDSYSSLFLWIIFKLGALNHFHLGSYVYFPFTSSGPSIIGIYIIGSFVRLHLMMIPFGHTDTTNPLSIESLVCAFSLYLGKVV